MQVIRVPGWGLGYGDACYWGRRHCLEIGPFMILWGQMTDTEIEAWDATRRPVCPEMQWPTEDEIRSAFKSHPDFGKTIRMVPASTSQEQEP